MQQTLGALKAVGQDSFPFPVLGDPPSAEVVRRIAVEEAACPVEGASADLVTSETFGWSTGTVGERERVGVFCNVCIFNL